LLEKREHRVLVAATGREALAIYESTQVDLILMDLQMPVMDGFEATRAIRKLNIHDKPVPIVALSVHHSRQDRERCLLAGMDACIAKPIDVNQLIELVESLATRRSTRADEATAARSTVNCQAAIGRLQGDRSLFAELTQLFDRDAPLLIDRIADGLSSGSPREVALAAHTLKGLAANFDAYRAVQAAGELESLANRGALEGGTRVLERLRLAVNEAVHAVNDYCRQMAGAEVAD
jgi:CheY-like chemotaxis protein